MDDQDSNNQIITIEPEISKILGLQDDFDLDPDEYLQLIREKLAEYDILSASKKITPKQQEEQRALAPKVREIRDQKRKGNVKYKSGKKISSSSFFGKKSEQKQQVQKRITDTSKLLPGTADKKSGQIVKYQSQQLKTLKGETAEKDLKENKVIVSISKIINSILDTLKNQFRFDQKKSDIERKDRENKKREKKESNLEKGFGMVKSAVQKMLAPFQNILDMIWRYFFFTFLGKAFTDLMNWLEDPKNKKKVEVLGRFLKDWWPLLLGAYLLFATPLGTFIKGTLKIVGGLTSQILKLLPRLLNLSKSLITSKPARAAGSALLNIVRSPLVWFPAAVAGTAALANEITGQRKAASVQAENKARAQQGKGLGVEGVGGVGDMGPTTPYGILQQIRSGGIIRGLRGYSSGAEVIEDGYNGIDSDTGVSITGAGRDTQLIAARPGEVVLTPEDVGHIQQKTGFDVYRFVGNRKPSYTSFNKIKTVGGIPLKNMGGILGFNNGGVVGNTPVLQLGRIISGNSDHRFDPTLSQSIPLLYRMLQSGRFAEKGWGDRRFLDQLTARLLVESGNFSRAREMYNTDPRDPKGKPGYNYFASYAGMIGNKNKDDAYNFRGRGAIQLTGRSNYEGFNRWLSRNGYKGIDVIKQPDLLATDPRIQALSTIYYLEDREKTFGVDFADIARRGDTRGFTYNVNGGYNHLLETEQNLRRIQGLRGGINYGTPYMPRNMRQVPRQNPIQSFASNLLNTLSGKPEQASARTRRPSRTRRPKRWALDPRGWLGMQGGGEIPQGPYTPLPSTGYVRPQGSFIPKPILRMPGPMPGSTVPFGWNPFKGLKGGGSLTPVTTRTGIDIPGGVSGADTQYMPNYNVALQPGEEIIKYVIPKDSAEKGVGQKILEYANQVVANTDSNSNAAKIGLRNKSINIKPYSGGLNSNITMLPSIKKTAGAESMASMTGPVSGSQVYSFDPVLASSFSVRKMNCDIYGIVE